MNTKEAFCLILWQANGGRITQEGAPLLEHGKAVRGYCSRPWDCYECPLLQDALANAVATGITALWVCPDCAGDALLEARTQNIEASLPGYFGEGFCQRTQCQRPLHSTDPIAARHSILLQLLTLRSGE